MLVPEKGKITVQLQGMETYLELPKTGYGYLWKLDRRSGKGVGCEDLTQYQDILNLVKGKLEPSVPFSGTRHPTLS